MTPVEMQNEVNRLTWERDRAQVKLAATQAENRRLRRMTKNGRYGSLLHQAAIDAKQLVGWRFAGYSISRRQAESYGMPRRRWEYGVALLRLGKVVGKESSTVWLDDSFLIDDLAAAENAIDAAFSRCEADDSIGRLRRYVPRSSIERRVKAGNMAGHTPGHALG